MIAMVDCNSFYASCEQVFRPDLIGKPVVVLSNNDGCIIAANKEAKELAHIPMFEPVFKIKDILIKNKVTFFSSGAVAILVSIIFSNCFKQFFASCK